jgi:hypothetical protein
MTCSRAAKQISASGPNEESASHFSHYDLASFRRRLDFDPLNFKLE